jgi:putative ABC transport system permease protein
MPYTLDKYMSKADTFAIADYQVILKTTEDDDGNRITTDTATAEEFSMDSLSTVSGVRVGEEITVYGYSDGSKIFDLPYDLPKGKVYISADYADKFGIDTGDEIELKAKFAKDAYRFEVAGIHEIFGSLSIMMPNDSFNEVFGNEKGSFSGFISNKQIKDIDDKYIGAVITRFDLMAMARQLSYSMGGIMDIFSYFCAAMAILIIYLLTKIIIENNAGSISMVKVLGYKPGEIGSLYVLLTTIVVVISTAAAAALSYYFVAWLWRYIMYGMAGWFKFEMDFLPILKCVVMVLVAYTIVALIDLRRIRRIPLTEALKNVE